ncbi:MAG: hypothetical protein IKY83_13920 [Proteobacteria bacterium]|nr:hypothetical protein [Pseudomonadota bacterium]
MDSTWILVAVGALFIIGLLALSFRGNAVSKATRVAIKTHDVGPVIAAIDEDKSGDMATSYNSAIKSLWDAYDRETAADLIKAFLERCDSKPIAQHWLKTVTEVEPEIARKKLGEEFIIKHTNEAAAAACAGGCGGGSCKSCKSCKS